MNNLIQLSSDKSEMDINGTRGYNYENGKEFLTHSANPIRLKNIPVNIPNK